MDSVKPGWFSELSTLWPGQSFSLEVEKVLFHEKSKFQDVMVFKSKTYGTVLVLDGVIQCTDKDEFSYQEMGTFLALNSHPHPKNVLIIGGGDGGMAREVAKHPLVESITQCEIDEMVINVSKKYLPDMAVGFASPKMNLHVGDGFEFMKKHSSQFDVIITDSSDPIGPASSLFEKDYYALMKSALKPGGIVCCQGECMWIHAELIKTMQDFCKTLYASVAYGYCCIPSYPCGQIGFTLCSLDPDTDFASPRHVFTEQQIKDLKLRYYSPEIHRAAFVLPNFMKEMLAGKPAEQEETKADNGS